MTRRKGDKACFIPAVSGALCSLRIESRLFFITTWEKRRQIPFKSKETELRVDLALRIMTGASTAAGVSGGPRARASRKMLPVPLFQDEQFHLLDCFRINIHIPEVIGGGSCILAAIWGKRKSMSHLVGVCKGSAAWCGSRDGQMSPELRAKSEAGPSEACGPWSRHRRLLRWAVLMALSPGGGAS